MAINSVRVDIQVFRGGRAHQLISLVDDVTGLAYNLTGYAAEGELKKMFSDSAATAQFTMTPVPLTTSGEFEYKLDTETIAPGIYVYDIKLTKTASETLVPVYGKLIIDPTASIP